MQGISGNVETVVRVNTGTSSNMQKPLMSSKKRNKEGDSLKETRSGSKTPKKSRFETIFGYKVPGNVRKSLKTMWHFLDDVASNFYLSTTLLCRLYSLGQRSGMANVDGFVWPQP